MANSTSPYRRIGSNSWQELLDQVNDVLQNPEPGCDPIAPIDPPDPMHRWAKSDIREVHDKLNEIPTDCFTFQPIPDLWKVSIIDDIEDQLANAWCDCTGEVCCYQCPNAGDFVTIFLGTETVGPNDCTECSATTADIAACNNIRTNIYIPAVIDFSQGMDAWSEHGRIACCKQEELDDLNDDLEKLQDQLDELNQNKTDCIASCSGDVACQNACSALYDPQISDKQTEISDKQAEIADVQAELNDAIAQRNAGIAQASGKCAAMNAAVDNMIWCDHTSARDLVDGLSYPIPQARIDCPPPDSADNGPEGSPPCPCGLDYEFIACQARYVVARRVYETVATACNGTPLTPQTGIFQGVSGGRFDVDGTPCHMDDGPSFGCTLVHLLYYCSSNCCCCLPVCGACCGHPDNDYNYDWQVTILLPREVSPQDQEGGACGDGIIGAGGGPTA